jgi:hypothetical protein
MRNFGKKSLDEIKERLAARGLIEAPEPSEASADEAAEAAEGAEEPTEETDDTDTTGDDELVAGEER